MATCSECRFFHPTEQGKGKCKPTHAERKICHDGNIGVRVDDSWAVVDGAEQACGEFNGSQGQGQGPPF